MIWRRVMSLVSRLGFGRRRLPEGGWSVDAPPATIGLPVGIIVLSVSVIAVLWAALFYDAKRSQDAAMAQSIRDAGNLVVAYREHIRRTIGAIDQLLIAIAAAHATHPNDFRLPDWVADYPLLKGIVVQVGVMDRNGMFQASNIGMSGPVDLSDRAHFRYHLDPAAAQPYISVPVVGRISNKWSIQITRRMSHDDTSFDGVVVVSVDPFYFSDFFNSIDLGNHGIAALVGLDHIVRARRGLSASGIGQYISGSRLFEELRKASTGHHISPSEVDHRERIHAYSTVPDYPLVVTIGFATGDVLAGPLRTARTQFAIGGILTLIIILLTWFTVRETKRRLDAERTRREDSFRLLFEGNPLPMWLIDVATMKFLAVNDAAVTHYGYSRDRFLQMSVLDIRPPEDREKVRRIIMSRDQGGNGDRISRHVKADGDGIDVLVYRRYLPYRGRDAALGAIIDVTERRRVEAERDRNRDFLNGIIDAVPVTIYVKDARDRRYILINRAGEKLWGLSRTEVIGKTAAELFSKETADKVAEIDQKALQSDSEVYHPAHTIYLPHNCTRVITSRRLSIRNADGDAQYILGVLEDVTQQTTTEEQLRQAQKMEAVGNLTGGIAHDFNNLLTIIIGNLDLLQSDVADNPDAAQKVDKILQASERSADLTRQMLAFSRRQSLLPKLVDINHLVADTMCLLSWALGEAITVDVQTAPDAGTVFVDGQQLGTALMNIAINARDAMPNGGTLTIATRNATLDPGHPAIQPDTVGGTYAVIEITDTGCGMPPEVLNRIFEPFFTTKAADKGTGLGLSMVYGFIKQSGGHISAYSEVGRGTTFRLYLPVGAEASARPALPHTPPPEQPNAARGQVILAVDDNPDVLAIVVAQLRSLGYLVCEADSAQTALQIISSPARVDLLFTDVVMPGGMNGKELATQARLQRPGLKVLFTSGFPVTSPASGAAFEDDDVLLSKPYRNQDLARALHGALAA